MLQINKSKELICRNVEVQIVFIRIGEIDTMNEKYVAEVIIECKWIDIDIYGEYDPNKHWNPRLYIENALNLYHEKINYETKNLENGFEITEKRIAKGKRKIFKKDIQKKVLIIKHQNKSDKI